MFNYDFLDYSDYAFGEYTGVNRQNSGAREALANELIRGELIDWGNKAAYLTRISADRLRSLGYGELDIDDVYRLGAMELHSAITHRYQNDPGLMPEFVAGMDIMKEKLRNAIVTHRPDYIKDPVSAIVDMAERGQLGCITDFIADMEAFFDRGMPNLI